MPTNITPDVFGERGIITRPDRGSDAHRSAIAQAAGFGVVDRYGEDLSETVNETPVGMRPCAVSGASA